MTKIIGHISRVNSEERRPCKMLLYFLRLRGREFNLSFGIWGIGRPAQSHIENLPTQEIRAAMELAFGGKINKKLIFDGTSMPKQADIPQSHMEFYITTDSNLTFWVVMDHESSQALKGKGIGKQELDGKICEIAFFD